MTLNVFGRLVRLLSVALIAASMAMPASAEKVLNRGNGAEPKGLDPHQASGDPENQILGDMFIGLYTEDVNGKPVLGSADNVATSEDGLTWTFTIRDHKWSDGRPVTAEDFVFAYRRILDPKTASEYASILYPIKNAEKVNKGTLPLSDLGVSAPDPKTFVIQLGHPAPYLPEMMTHYSTFPLPKHVVEAKGTDWTKAGVMASNGPYMLAERRPFDRIKLVRNPHFYDAASVKIDVVNFFPTTDEAAALKRYRAGELDTIDRWPLAENKWLLANIPNETKKYPGLRVLYTVFNMRKAPLNDRRVRLALALAVDRATIQKEVYFGVHGLVAENVLPPGMANADLSAKVPWSGKSMDERRAEAKALLQAAGFGPAKPLKLTYSFIKAGYEAQRDRAAVDVEGDRGRCRTRRQGLRGSLRQHEDREFRDRRSGLGVRLQRRAERVVPVPKLDRAVELSGLQEPRLRRPDDPGREREGCGRARQAARPSGGTAHQRRRGRALVLPVHPAAREVARAQLGRNGARREPHALARHRRQVG